jgi:hypothetical protein
MSPNDLRSLNERQLVERFRHLALEQESALLDSNTRKYNRLYDKIEAIESELRARGPEARKSLLVLLEDSNLRVRYEAARRCLTVSPERAMIALQSIAASHLMPVAGDAGMTLERLKSGQYRPT